MCYRSINAAYDLGVALEIRIVVWTCGGKVGISKGTSISFNNPLSPKIFLSLKAGKVERRDSLIRRCGKPVCRPSRFFDPVRPFLKLP